MSGAEAPQELFEALSRARPLLIDAFGDVGVSHVEYVVGFAHPFTVSVWLGTVTDEQRDALPSFLSLLETADPILDEAGIPRAVVGRVAVTAQSQETVDRDFRGSWFYARR